MKTLAQRSKGRTGMMTRLEAEIDQQAEEIDRLRDELSATPEHRLIASLVYSNDERLRWKGAAKWAAKKVLDGSITETEQRRARSILNAE